MQILLLSLAELCDLIVTPRSGECFVDDNVRCVAAVDVLYEIELIKKRDIADKSLPLVKSRSCQLFNATETGQVLVESLDRHALERGLFEISEDYCEVDLWETALQPETDPLYSARLITLRSFDLNWETGLASQSLLAQGYASNAL